jgi:hypothetical protein
MPVPEPNREFAEAGHLDCGDETRDGSSIRRATRWLVASLGLPRASVRYDSVKPPHHSAVGHLRGQPHPSIGYDTAAQLGREAHVVGWPELEEPPLGRRIDVESLDPLV